MIFSNSGLAVVFAEDAPEVSAADPPNCEYFILLLWPIVADFCVAAWSALCPEYSAKDPDTHFGGPGS